MLHHSQISLHPHSFCELSKINDLRNSLTGAAQLVAQKKKKKKISTDFWACC